MAAYRHGKIHLKKARKRKALAVKRRYRGQLPPLAEINPSYGPYYSRTGRYVIPGEKPYYRVAVYLPSRHHLLYKEHRAPFRMYLSITYDVEDLAGFQTRQAAINAAWRVYHQDEDWRNVADMATRGK